MKIRLFTIPNLITLGNLLCGCIAILFILDGKPATAFWLVIAAAVLDFFDGFTARLLKQYSPLGVQLDSLSDMVSFGVAPSFMLYYMYTSSGGEAWWMPGIYAVFVVALFSALRLAKFNIDEEQKEEFVGLNTPACAIFVTSAGWLYANGAFTIQPWIVLAVAVLLSVLLISPIRMFSFKFKSYALRPNALRYAFLLLSVIALGLFRIAAVPFIIMGYVVVSIGRNIVCSGKPKMTTK